MDRKQKDKSLLDHKMVKQQPKSNIFLHGAAWLRADFHLHTQADAEFKKGTYPHSFQQDYIDQLKRMEIRVAVITNHNKFDLEEFKALRKMAEREEIYLIPGIEFSIQGGAKGLHILIVFDDTWIYNKENRNYIQDFIIAAFTGKTSYDSPPYNQNSNFNFTQTCQKLDEFGKDYFIVMAHVDDSSGLFNEFDGRGIKDVVEAECFKNRVLALQKSRKRDHLKDFPSIALVEGSDSAQQGIEAIGNSSTVQGITQKTFIKLGAYNFPALKFALRSHKLRVSPSLPDANRLWLKQLIINPETEREVVIPLNSGLNTLIGVRGGGKSSVLEAIRYVLELPLPEDWSRRQDREYKEEIVRRLFGNGGWARLELADKTENTAFYVERHWNNRAELFDKGHNPVSDQRPSDIFQVAYFGQKDLEYAGQNFNGQFIEEKLLQQELAPVKAETAKAKELVRATHKRLCGLQDDLDTLDDVNAEVKRLKSLQTNYQKYNLQQRLELITHYDEEEDYLSEVQESLNQMMGEMNDYVQTYAEELEQLLRHEPKVEQTIFKEAIFPEIQQVLERLNEWTRQSDDPEESEHTILAGFFRAVQLFEAERHAKQKEFEALKREIDDPSINVESFRDVERKLRVNIQKQQILKKKEKEYDQLEGQLNKDLDILYNCWRREYEVTKKALDQFNETSNSIDIQVAFLGDNQAFVNKLKDWARGSNLREEHYRKIAKNYESGVQIYRDRYKEESNLHNILRGGYLLPNFQEKLMDCEDELLTWRTPDSFEFRYNNRPLQEYSLGQRATALTAFILAQQHKDLFLIDQPEDDLDNQTVARELIHQVVQTKTSTQYIFATHNPNIVVLGDSDQIVECQFTNDLFVLESVAGIDDKKVQEAIVNIMEGGKEALETRTRFYQIANSWKH